MQTDYLFLFVTKTRIGKKENNIQKHVNLYGYPKREKPREHTDSIRVEYCGYIGKHQNIAYTGAFYGWGTLMFSNISAILHSYT